MVQSYKGFTLIELMVVLVLLAILAALGMPALRDTLENRRLRSASTGVTTVINEWLAFARARPMDTTSLTVDLTAACMGYSLVAGMGSAPAACDCTAAAAANRCLPGGFEASSVTGLALSHSLNSANFLVTFDPVRGLVTANGTGDYILAVGGKQVNVTLTANGSVRACSNNVPGYAPC